MEGKTINILEFPVPEDMNLIMDLQYQIYEHPLEHRYYLAYETNPEKPDSTLFNDLKWISKHFGVTMFDENCDITHLSLNNGRIAGIERMRDILKKNVTWVDYDNLKPNGMVDITDGMGKLRYITKTDEKGILTKVSERLPKKLTKEGRKYYQDNIDKGLMVLCKYVRKVDKYVPRKIFKDDVLN